MVAAAIVAVGLTAAAVLASTLMQQQELNASSLRAANLQEQAAKLFRLDLNPNSIRSILPEVCVAASAPPAGGYSIVFTRPTTTNIVIGNTPVALQVGSLRLLYKGASGTEADGSNSVTIVRPTTRVQYDQN